MSGTRIGSLFAAVFADMTGFEATVTKGAEQAGDKGGKAMAGRMGTALKVGLGGALGGIAAGLFAGAARGGQELSAAVASFTSETGASAEEAKVAQGSIEKLYKNNLNGFEELGAVLAAVTTNLGLSGDAAEAAAQKALDYAKVTGTDAVDAVTALDDLTDAYNLTAADQAVILDKLVVAHQKYGGSVEENQKALVDLAPALTAANLSFDDGIALLDAFAASGVDAADAPAALTKALGNVKSPEELQKLIADIGAIEDPFVRAQKASELFGKKAGPKLAQALAKGKLSDFTVSVDEATGALEKASDAIDAAPLNQVQLALKNVGGTLAEVGTNFGPLILGFSTLVPALGPVLAGAGAALGGILAAAIPVGMAALPALLIAAAVAAIAFVVANPKIVGEAAKVGEGIVSGIVDFLGRLPAALAAAFGPAFDAVLAALPGFVSQVAVEILKLPFRILDLQVKMLEFFAGIGTQILAGLPGFIDAFVGFLFTIPGRLVGLGEDILGAIVDGLSKLPDKVASIVQDAFANLKIDVGPFHISSSGVTIDTPTLGFAQGGVRPAGVLSWVGEHGPELEAPLTPSLIIPHDLSMAIAGGSGPGGAQGDFIVNMNVGKLEKRTMGDVHREMKMMSDKLNKGWIRR